MVRKILLTGRDLSVEELVALAEDEYGEVFVYLDEEAVSRIREARIGLLDKISSGAQVYGTTTRTGAEKGRSVGEGQAFQREVAAGYAGAWGDQGQVFPPGTCRAAWTILLNQFAGGTNVISLQLAQELVLWINGAWDKNSYLHRYLPALEKGASISYADLTAPMTLMMATLCKRSLTEDSDEGFQFQAGEVLALGSSNCFTMAEAAISLNRIEKLLALSEQAAAMDIEAERSTPFIISRAAEDIAQWREKKEVIARMRSFMKGSRVWFDQPSSIHPFVTLRASPDILATAREALSTAKKIVKDMANGHQGNPVVVGPWNSSISGVEVGPVCSFDSTRLFIAYSNLQQAMSCLAISIAQRANHLVNNNGASCGQLFSRRFEVYIEASLREVLMAGQVIPATMGRTNMVAGYDWAAPAAQAASQLDQLVAGFKRLAGVHLVVSCAVIDHKLGEEAENTIGYGLRDLYYSIHRNSYHRLPLTQQFSLGGVLRVVDGYVERVAKIPVDEGIELYKVPTEETIQISDKLADILSVGA